MRRKQRIALPLFALFVVGQGMAQVQVDGSGNYRLNPTTPGPRTFTIGNAYITGAGSALNVRGDLLGTGYNTGEVFRTDAPDANSTYWRLLRGGTEYGRLWNRTDNTRLDPCAIKGAILTSDFFHCTPVLV